MANKKRAKMISISKIYDKEDGVWRTIGGRRVFIRTGQSLSDAMKESGKFKTKITEQEKQNIQKNSEKPSINTITQEEYDKMPKDYKGTLKELVDTAEFRGENKEELRTFYEKQGYDVDKDKTILKYNNGGTVLQPVKISSDIGNKEQQLSDIGDKEDKFYTRKDGTKEYDAYKGTRFEKKYDSMDDVIKDPNSALNKYISEKEQKDELKEISGGAISTLQTTTPKSKADRLKPGTEIYYTGDQANIPGYFTVEKFEPEKEQYLASITLKEKGGEGRTFKIGSQSIASEYGKDPGARFSFKEDYDNYRNKIFEGYRKQAEERKAKEKVELSKQIAREIYGKGISDEVAERYGKDLIPLQEGTVTSELRDWEWDKEKLEWSKEALQNRLTYLTKGYDEAQKEGKKFEEAFERNSLRTKYKGTFEYLEETTNMSGNEILELLKKIEQDKK